MGEGTRGETVIIDFFKPFTFLNLVEKENV